MWWRGCRQAKKAADEDNLKRPFRVVIGATSRRDRPSEGPNTSNLETFIGSKRCQHGWPWTSMMRSPARKTVRSAGDPEKTPWMTRPLLHKMPKGAARSCDGHDECAPLATEPVYHNAGTRPGATDPKPVSVAERLHVIDPPGGHLREAPRGRTFSMPPLCLSGTRPQASSSAARARPARAPRNVARARTVGSGASSTRDAPGAIFARMLCPFRVCLPRASDESSSSPSCPCPRPSLSASS